MDNVREAGDLLGFLSYYSWDFILISFLITLTGTLSHYAKKCLRSEADWDTYWQNNKRNTALSLVSMVGAYFGVLVNDPNASLLTFIAIGYATDSLANKAPSSRKRGI